MDSELVAELVDAWTLVDADTALLGRKSGVTRAGFAVLVKFFQLHGRFPADERELPPRPAEYVAA